MDFDALAYAIESLTREMVHQRECMDREIVRRREAVQAWENDMREWQVIMLENAKRQLSVLEGIHYEATMTAQSLRDCEGHLKDLADRLAPPLYDD